MGFLLLFYVCYLNENLFLIWLIVVGLLDCRMVVGGIYAQNERNPISDLIEKDEYLRKQIN